MYLLRYVSYPHSRCERRHAGQRTVARQQLLRVRNRAIRVVEATEVSLCGGGMWRGVRRRRRVRMDHVGELAPVLTQPLVPATGRESKSADAAEGDNATPD